MDELTRRIGGVALRDEGVSLAGDLVLEAVAGEEMVEHDAYPLLALDWRGSA